MFNVYKNKKISLITIKFAVTNTLVARHNLNELN